MTNTGESGILIMLRDGSWEVKFIVSAIYRILQHLFDPSNDNKILSELVKSCKTGCRLSQDTLNKIPELYKAIIIRDSSVNIDVAKIILLSCEFDKSGKIVRLVPPVAGDYCEFFI